MVVTPSCILVESIEFDGKKFTPKMDRFRRLIAVNKVLSTLTICSPYNSRWILLNCFTLYALKTFLFCFDFRFFLNFATTELLRTEPAEARKPTNVS